jgi:hypothetical protein
LVQERNKAWDNRNLLKQRVDELEEYNVNLHEKFHMLYNGVGPNAPPDAAGMDIDDDEEDEPTASPRGDGDVSDPDDGPDDGDKWGASV